MKTQRDGGDASNMPSAGMWNPPLPPGYLPSIQTLGSAVAPLLAGAAFTMTALLFPSLAAPPQSAFSKWPEISLALFVATGICMISTVQAALWVRRYECTPDELCQWWPEHVNRQEEPDAWLRTVQSNLRKEAYAWAERARAFFHVGILCLLAGVAVVSQPPSGMDPGRTILVLVAWGSFIGEVIWILRAEFLSSMRRKAAHADVTIILAFMAAFAAEMLAQTDELGDTTAEYFLLIALPVAASAELFRIGVRRRRKRTSNNFSLETWPLRSVALQSAIQGITALALLLSLVLLVLRCDERVPIAVFALGVLALAAIEHALWLLGLLRGEQDDNQLSGAVT